MTISLLSFHVKYFILISQCLSSQKSKFLRYIDEMTEIDFSHLIIFLLFLRAPCQNKYALARKAHLEKVDGRLAKNGWRKVVANGNSLGGLESNF